jgi:sulfur-oxidizing protein SoxZ
MATRALIRLPSRAKPGEVITVRVAVSHPMETGHRPGPEGRVLPRDIVRRFECEYDGQRVFAADLHPAVAANPYLSFTTVATRSAELVFRWQGDNGFAHEERRRLDVAG